MSESNFYELSEKHNKILRLLWRLKLPAFETIAAFQIVSSMDWMGEKMLPAYILAAVLQIAGRLTDKKSSLNLIDTLNTADKLGIEHDIVESNPHSPGRPNSQELLGKKRIVIDAAYMIPGIIFPPFGLVLSGFSLLATVNNNDINAYMKERISFKTSTKSK